MAKNYLELGELIVARLSACLPRYVRVLTADDLAGVQEKDQPVPAIHVLYTSDKMIDKKGFESLIEQTWYCVVVQKNQRSAQERMQEIGRLIPLVLNALAEWEPIGECVYHPIERTSAQIKILHRAGFTYHPLAFKASFYWSVSPCPSI